MGFGWIETSHVGTAVALARANLFGTWLVLTLRAPFNSGPLTTVILTGERL